LRGERVRRRGEVAAGNEDLDEVGAGLYLLRHRSSELCGRVDLVAEEVAMTTRSRQPGTARQHARPVDLPGLDAGAHGERNVVQRPAVTNRGRSRSHRGSHVGDGTRPQHLHAGIALDEIVLQDAHRTAQSQVDVCVDQPRQKRRVAAVNDWDRTKRRSPRRRLLKFRPTSHRADPAVLDKHKAVHHRRRTNAVPNPSGTEDRRFSHPHRLP
jgi:hypothetical protein